MAAQVLPGHREREWWSEEAVGELEEHRSWPSGPRWAGHARFDRPTLPVVGVSRPEAEAYLAWLTPRLREEGELAADEVLRLPSGEEWERLAGGAEGRRYPWGDEWGDGVARCNHEELGLGGASPVHMFPEGRTPDGACWDLAGNVWEWVADEHGRPLRGGSYLSERRRVGSAARSRYHPWNCFHDIGFRGWVVPVSRSAPDS